MSIFTVSLQIVIIFEPFIAICTLKAVFYAVSVFQMMSQIFCPYKLVATNMAVKLTLSVTSQVFHEAYFLNKCLVTVCNSAGMLPLSHVSLQVAVEGLDLPVADETEKL